MKTFFFTILTILLFSWFSIAHAAIFVDVSSQHPQHQAIEYLHQQGIIKGQGDGDRFTPDQQLNRAEWAEILIRQARLIPNPFTGANEDCFFDVSREWFATSVCMAASRGWIKGYQAGPERGYFLPVRTLNMAEILVTLSRAHEWNIPAGEFWFSGALQFAKDAGIVSSSVRFDEPITRSKAAEILFRSLLIQRFNVQQFDPLLIDLLPQDSEESGQEDPSQTPVSATVRLSAFPEQPSPSTLAKGALYVPVLRFQLRAEQDVQLREISVRRVSVGRTEDLDIGRLLINGQVVQEMNFFSGENAVFWRDLDVQIGAGQTILIEMNVDFVEDALPHLVYQFETEPERILFTEAGVSVTGDKIIGKVFTIGPIAADQITITNPTSALKIPFIESEDQILARFRITAGEHDVLIKRIHLEDAGRMDNTEFANFRLSAGSEVIATKSDLNLNVIDFIVNDFLIEAGRTRTFTVMGDILEAEKDDTIRLFLKNPEDIHAYDLRFGFGARVNNEFGFNKAFCVGSETIQCPAEGLRKHCSAEDREFGVKGCEE